MFPPGFPPADLELLPDLTFSRHGLKLDLLRSRRQAGTPRPAILHLHGGAWVKFSKWPVANVFLARAGFITVSADYRLAPGAIFPAQLHDVKTAVRWLRAHAEEFQIESTRIGVWGISAGAHLAGLLGTTADQPELEGEDWSEGFSSGVQAVGNVSGPMDFFDPGMPFSEEPFELLGGPWRERQALAAQASPIHHVSQHAAPFLHIHGVQDEEVPVSQARRMHEALLGAGARSELRELPGGHYINDTHQAQVEKLLLHFFQQELVSTGTGL